MRCKKHATDLSTIVGVCASCLRERLLRLIAAQEQYEAQLLANKHNNSETNPPFPRSVSPYITRRKSDNSVAPDAAVPVPRPYNKPRLHHSLSDQRFYSSPQIAVTTGGCIGDSSSNRKKPNLIRFSSFSNLFRSNNNNGNGDSDSNSNSCGGAGQPTSVTSSPAWFSNVLPGGGSSSSNNHKKKKSSDFDESSTTAASGGGVVRKQRCYRNRGMSPVRSFDDGGEDEFSDGSSEFESVESCKQTPRKTPSTIRRCGGGGGGHRSVSEMIFCLSPLVRASPNRLWSHKGKPPVDGGGGGGDGRIPVVPHLSNVKSFCANRSRKLADFGRSDLNR